MFNMRGWQMKIREWAISKEWRGSAATPRSLPEDIALIHSEVSEALEAFRLHNKPGKSWHTFSFVYDGVKYKDLTDRDVRKLFASREENVIFLKTGIRGDSGKVYDFPAIALPDGQEILGKPEGVGSEFADTLIRLLDTSEEHGLDMDDEVERKMIYNETRAIRHGGKYL